MKTSKYLYQYDVNQSFTDIHGTYVDCIINNVVYRIAAVNGSCLIPDELLQIKGSHKVYECFDDGTITEFTFTVTERPMPPDYVYTPTQRLTFDGLVKKVNDAVAELYGMAEDGIFDGDDGVSPEVSVSVITGGHKVTITDVEGEHSFNVLNGTNGAKGDKGDKGDQGEKGDDGDAYTITDADYSAIAAMTAPMVTGFVKTVNNIEPDANGNVNVQGGGGSSDVTKAYVDQQDQHIIDMIPDVSGKADKSEIPVVPSNVSAFTNDAEYITSSDIPSIPTKTSELTNDSDFTTTGEVADQLDLKQNKLVAGANISIDEDTNTISATGSGGSTVTMSDNVSGGVDLTVDGTKKTIAKESDVTSLNNALSKLRTYVTPEMFGAVGDGITDDLTAINSALNSGASRVVFSKKEYLIDLDSFTNINGVMLGVRIPNGVHLEGNGATIKCSYGSISSRGTVLVSTSNYLNATYDSTAQRYSGNKISNLIIDGGIQNQGSVYSQTGIAIGYTENAVISNVEVKNLCGTDGSGYGVIFAFCNNGKLESSIIESASRSCIYNWESMGMLFTNLYINGGYFRDCVTQSTFTPHSYQGSSGTYLQCIMKHENTSGTHVFRVTGDDSTADLIDCTIIGNSSIDGVSVPVTTGSKCLVSLTNCNISGCSVGVNQTGSGGDVEINLISNKIESIKAVNIAKAKKIYFLNNMFTSTNETTTAIINSVVFVIDSNFFQNMPTIKTVCTDYLMFSKNILRDSVPNVGNYILLCTGGYQIIDGNMSNTPEKYARIYASGKAINNHFKIDSSTVDVNTGNS